MFRRPGKSPYDKDSSFKEENPPYAKYGVKKIDPSSSSDSPPRIFDLPPTTEGGIKESWQDEKSSSLTHHFQSALREELPETTLGEGVTFRGELSFERLLRIDGTFEGELLSQGKVIVGPKGKVKANLNLREAIIEGEVRGNITVQERLELRRDASIYGDITAKTLSVDEGVTIVGCVTVHPHGDA